MSNADELVNEWLLAKFLKEGWSYDRHGPAELVEIVEVESGWECGCYSEFTRDDSFEFEGLFNSQRGTFYWTYGRWADLPDFIRELDEYAEGPDCGYDEEA